MNVGIVARSRRDGFAGAVDRNYQRMGPMRNRLIILAIAFIAIFGTIGRSRDACAFDADSVFTPWKKSVSIEASFAHFGIHLGESGWVQACN